MALPDPLEDFWRAVTRPPIVETSVSTPWGVVITDSRFPLVWDANHALVFACDGGLALEEIRATLLPALREAGAHYEHIEFWGVGPTCSAQRSAAHLSGRSDADVVMVLEEAPSDDLHPDHVMVREVHHPGEDLWRWYRDSRNEFGDHPLSDETIDQLVRRDRDVFVPAGGRWFVGYVDGKPAGLTSLLRFADVGYIDNVVTMPVYRRRGVATATVLHAVEASREAGDRALHLLAEEAGSPRGLYERLGFRARARVESFTRPLAS
jgi:ribosomal protein S18 acetylase RimI-like enzyme